ncbi:MAG: ABC transporter permease [Verrucomicrobiales bacterium]|nr:ABC transporter permease [Verrucomicrobiales bacterium]
MKKTLAIALSSFHELIRQPFWLILGSGGVVFMLVLAHSNYFALGEESRQVKQSVLAFMLVAGLIAAVLGASFLVAREVRSGTALVVLSKPVGRLPFLLGKYTGLMTALALQGFLHLLVALLAGRMAREATGNPDWLAITVTLGAVVAGLGLAAASSFFLHRSFVGDAVLTTVASVGVAFAVVNAFDSSGSPQPWGSRLDSGLVTAGVLIFAALGVLAALALALSTRLSMVPTLLLCGGFLALGLLSDYLFASSSASRSTLADLLHDLLPNWQVFWVADSIGSPRPLSWGYVARAAAYGVLHIATALCLAWFLFAHRELD